MNMQFHSHSRKQRKHASTKFIQLDTHRCQACWQCVETCPTHVLGKVSVFMHRHARVDHPDDCNGCKKCVRNCPHDAIRYTYIPPMRGSRLDAGGGNSSGTTLESRSQIDECAL